MAASWPESAAGSVNRNCSVRRTFASSVLIAVVLFDVLAEFVARIDAEDAQRLRLRDELQLFEREFERAVPRMTLHVGIELRGGEAAANHVAFQLGHVDAVGGKAAQRLVQRGRDIAHLENKSRH